MYEHKDLYVIDFSNVKHYFEMHFAIRDALGFPDYYGCNWDALWDCLTDMIGEPIHIEIRGFDVFEERFASLVDKLLGLLSAFRHYRNDKYLQEIHIDLLRGDRRESIP